MRGLAVLLAVVCVTYAVDCNATSTFQIHVPEGWTNLAGPEARKSVAAARAAGAINDELAQRLQSTDYAAFAVHPTGDSGLYESMNAVVKDGASPITIEALNRLVEQFRTGTNTGINSKVVMREPEVFTIAGVHCGKITSDLELNGTPMRNTIYLLPSKSQMANVTFSAPRDVFEQHRGLYEATVASTGGLAEPVSSNPALPYIIAASTAAGVVAAETARRRRAAQGAKNEKAQTG